MLTDHKTNHGGKPERNETYFVWTSKLHYYDSAYRAPGELGNDAVVTVGSVQGTTLSSYSRVSSRDNTHYCDDWFTGRRTEHNDKIFNEMKLIVTIIEKV
ncbi:hypothetical protein BaRGS_00024731 [Batillaria attramentaria]|uniref:Uncharacterized protein n=1 Tax=Batillaria attramentaria TaxID=370345 RepID=A0ABD0KAJ3_9CAEN